MLGEKDRTRKKSMPGWNEEGPSKAQKWPKQPNRALRISRSLSETRPSISERVYVYRLHLNDVALKSECVSGSSLFCWKIAPLPHTLSNKSVGAFSFSFLFSELTQGSPGKWSLRFMYPVRYISTLYDLCKVFSWIHILNCWVTRSHFPPEDYILWGSPDWVISIIIEIATINDGLWCLKRIGMEFQMNKKDTWERSEWWALSHISNCQVLSSSCNTHEPEQTELQCLPKPSGNKGKAENEQRHENAFLLFMSSEKMPNKLMVLCY